MALFDELRSRCKVWADQHDKMSLPLWLALGLLSLIRKIVRHTIAEAAERRYDKTLGIDTGGEIIGTQLRMAPEERAYAKGYAGTPPTVAERLIGLVADRARGFTFIDYGAGKGRVLLIAARHQFDRVVGVELSEPLIRVAWQPCIAAYAPKASRTMPDRINELQTDAANYELPQTSVRAVFLRPVPGRSHGAYRPAGSWLLRGQPKKACSSSTISRLSLMSSRKLPFMRRQDVTDLPGGPMNRYGKPTASIFETMP